VIAQSSLVLRPDQRIYELNRFRLVVLKVALQLVSKQHSFTVPRQLILNYRTQILFFNRHPEFMEVWLLQLFVLYLYKITLLLNPFLHLVIRDVRLYH
jgi:hypothetical protein